MTMPSTPEEPAEPTRAVEPTHCASSPTSDLLRSMVDREITTRRADEPISRAELLRLIENMHPMPRG